MTLLFANLDPGAAAEGIGRFLDALIVMVFEVVTAGGLAVVFVWARKRRLTEKGQARFEVHSRKALGLPKPRPWRAPPYTQITIATWLAAFVWFAVAFGTTRMAIACAVPWDQAMAAFFGVVWGTVIAALSVVYGWRTRCSATATVAAVHLAAVRLFAWLQA